MFLCLAAAARPPTAPDRPRKPFFHPGPPSPPRPARRLTVRTRPGAPRSVDSLSLEELLKSKGLRGRNRRLSFFGKMKDLITGTNTEAEKEQIMKEMERNRFQLAFFQPEANLGDFLNSQTEGIKAEVARVLDRFADLDEQIATTMTEGYNSLIRMSNG